MQKPNERTLKMMENFIELRNSGHSIAEIAKLYNLSETTIYTRLSEIAERAGVSRESLLEKPFEADHSGRNFAPVKPVDTTKLNAHFSVVMTELAKAKQEIDGSIEELEIMHELLKEEITR